LPNHPIRSRQHIGRDGQADLLRSFKIDDQFKLGQLLDRLSMTWALCGLKHRISSAGISLAVTILFAALAPLLPLSEIH
jgi:hypothetical protein